jgi:hypothetical protein
MFSEFALADSKVGLRLSLTLTLLDSALHKTALASIPEGHGKVTGPGKFGHSDVKFCISDGQRCLKCTGLLPLDGFEDIWGLSRSDLDLPGNRAICLCDTNRTVQHCVGSGEPVARSSDMDRCSLVSQRLRSCLVPTFETVPYGDKRSYVPWVRDG